MPVTINLDVEGLRGTLKFIEFKFCEKSSLLNNLSSLICQSVNGNI